MIRDRSITRTLCLSPFVFLLVMHGCGAAQDAQTASESAGSPAAASSEPEESCDAHSQIGERKIIYEASLNVIVEEFNDVPSRVQKLAEESHGYIAHSRLDGNRGYQRSGTWRIRVPTESYANFLQAAEGLGELESRQEDSIEVTAQYVDLNARISAKTQEEERLLSHLKQDTAKLEDILAVEKELMRVRTELEQLQGELRLLSDRIAMSTVTLMVREIRNYVPPASPTFNTRIARAWTESLSGLWKSLQELTIFAVFMLPWMVVLAVPVIGVALLRTPRRTSKT